MITINLSPCLEPDRPDWSKDFHPCPEFFPSIKVEVRTIATQIEEDLKSRLKESKELAESGLVFPSAIASQQNHVTSLIGRVENFERLSSYELSNRFKGCPVNAGFWETLRSETLFLYKLFLETYPVFKTYPFVENHELNSDYFFSLFCATNTRLAQGTNINQIRVIIGDPSTTRFIKGINQVGIRQYEDFIAKVCGDLFVGETINYEEFHWLEDKERFYTLNECVLCEWEEITEKEYLSLAS